MELVNQNILIISNEPWGEFWYSKHNYANELSKKNKVFFLNPPKPFALKNIFNKQIFEKNINSNLHVIEYANALPVSILGFWKLNDKIILNRLRKYFNRKSVKNILFWTFDPIRLAFPEILSPKKIILHAVDAYLFTYASEKIISERADLIICVSDKIAETYKKYNSNVIVIPHSIPDDEFLPVNQKRNAPLKGIFAGKLDKRIDLEFNISIFKVFPFVNFTIVGSASAEFIDRIKKENLTNVTLIPPVKSAELRTYISHSDFCFIFKKIYSGNNIFSHKLLQYLAQGKPIFGTEFSDISPELKNTLYLSNSISDIKKMLADFSENTEPYNKTELRINYAKQHTFSKTLSHIENILN